MKRNPYLPVTRLEFVITYACSGHCRHCSLGASLKSSSVHVGTVAAVKAMEELTSLYRLESVMTFGGEPLLYAETVAAIHETARELGIPKRDVITNGYFTKNEQRRSEVARLLKNSGVTNVLLSVDAFHQDVIPLDAVAQFVVALQEQEVPGVRLHPAWVGGRGQDNPYNKRTDECLRYLEPYDLPVSKGNNIFPSGNAAKYLAEYFEMKPLDLQARCGERPYTSRLDQMGTLSVSPNGDVMACSFVIGNINRESILDIVDRYDPYRNPFMKALMDGGVGALVKLAEEQGVSCEPEARYSPCDLCRDIVGQLERQA